MLYLYVKSTCYINILDPDDILITHMLYHVISTCFIDMSILYIKIIATCYIMLYILYPWVISTFFIYVISTCHIHMLYHMFTAFFLANFHRKNPA